ncbi:hypothetical protein JCM33374_g5469 [Metschnikowia sp. JCM 33374]|nr:hypothetical protein JCM33374_g5469 [Metschnikowia sp. JCM 33374]
MTKFTRVVYFISSTLLVSVWALGEQPNLMQMLTSKSSFSSGSDDKVPAELARQSKVKSFGTSFYKWLLKASDNSFSDEFKNEMFPSTAQMLEAIIENPVNVPGYQKVNIETLDDFQKKEIGSLMKNKQTTFITKDKSNIVFFDKEEKSWILQSFDPSKPSSNIEHGKKIPLSKVVDTQYGSSASVSSLFRGSIRLDTTVEVPADIKQQPHDVVIFSLSGHVQVGTTLKISGSIGCVFEGNQFARPYVTPFYIEVREGKKTKVKYQKGKGLLLKGEWEKTEAFSRLAAVPPMVECHVGGSSLDPATPQQLDVLGLMMLMAQ